MRFRSFVLALTAFAVGAAAQAQPFARIIAGAGAGSPPQVVVRDGGAPAFDFLAYGASFTGGVRVAVGDVSGDGVADLVTSPAAGTGQRVRVLDGVSGLEAWGFYPFTIFHTGGIFVAAGDVNGDGRADVVAGADAGGPTQVKVYDGATQLPIADFVAFDAAFEGGVRVATGDVNGDGLADLLLGTGPGGGRVKILDGADLAPLADFEPYGITFPAAGVFVAAGDVDGNGRAEPVVGPDEDPNGAWEVYVIDDDFIDDEIGTPIDILARIVPFGETFTGGVRVATADVDGDALADLLFAPGPGHAPTVRQLRGFDQAALGDFDAFGPSFTGGIFVGAAPIPAAESDGAGVAALCLVRLALRRSAPQGREGRCERREQSPDRRFMRGRGA